MNIINSTTKILEACKSWIAILQNIIAEVSKSLKNDSKNT